MSNNLEFRKFCVLIVGYSTCVSEMSDKRVCEVGDEAGKNSTKAKQSSKTGGALWAEAVPLTSEMKTLDQTKNNKPEKPPAEVLPQSVSAQLSEISELLYALNDRAGQLEDRDCSGTSAPLQSHHYGNDDSESGSASPARSTSDFPIFSLSARLELDNDDEVCADDFARVFISDDKTSELIQDKLAESINAGLCLTADKTMLSEVVQKLKRPANKP